jgi:hypothetical protein
MYGFLSLYHSLETFLLKMCPCTYVHSALIEKQILVTRTIDDAHLLAHLFLGLSDCDDREGDSDRNIIFRCSFIGGISYCPFYYLPRYKRMLPLNLHSALPFIFI